jgi:hypothetical protein
MDGKSKRSISPLAEAEMEVLEEGREWMRRRLERKLQRVAEAEGDFSPLEREGFSAPAPPSDRSDDKRGEG